MKKPFILVDASSYFFRAFHALPPLMNSKGKPTGAIYGVINMIKRLLKDYQPEHIGVVFDAKGKTFRDDLYAHYKAHRKVMPDNLSIQFAPLMELLEAMGLPPIIIEGVEADDVIGTLALKASQAGSPVLISTSDKDLAQLVTENIKLINTMSNQVLDPAGVFAKFGVHPHQIIDYLTLIGDSTDNIPGVTKCGPKTAAKWLSDFQTLDALVTNADSITGKIGEYLRESLAHLPLSKELITIKTDVSLPWTWETLHIKPSQRDRLIALTKELEFRSWLKELLTEEANNQTSDNQDTVTPLIAKVIQTDAELLALVTLLNKAPYFSLSLMGTHAEAMQADIVGISICLESLDTVDKPRGVEKEVFYIPLTSNPHFLETLKPLFENKDIKKIGHNQKYDYCLLKKAGIKLQGLFADTMLESYVLNSVASRHDLDSLAIKYLGHKSITLTEMTGTGLKQISLDQVTLDKLLPFATEASLLPYLLHETLYPRLDEPLKKLFHELEMPLIPVLAEMEYHGVCINEETLQSQGHRLKARMQALEEEAFVLAGTCFNLNSPKQLQEILFDKLQLPVLIKTPTGQPSTAESVLQDLSYEYRLPEVILEYRSLNKLVTTYIDVFPKRLHPSTHRIHTCYNQAVTATGRLSSSEPNMQNIPIRREEGRLIRKAFVASKDHLILAADYSQIELRIMAHLSRDPNLLFAFREGLDIHTATASEIFGVSLEKVDSEHRRRAKAVNFGLIYGMSAFGLAKQIGVERKDAQSYIDRYFLKYPGVKTYMEQTRQLAREYGYVETLMRRRLYIPEILTSNMMRRNAAERAAINAPMQGTAADIIKKAMIDMDTFLQKEDIKGIHLIMQVHDELVFEVHESMLDLALSQIKLKMEEAFTLSVPLEVSVGVGKNWDEAH